LLEIELSYAHKPQIKALNAEQVPAEIEQAKVLTSHFNRYLYAISNKLTEIVKG
jgi:hypothetical protein